MKKELPPKTEQVLACLLTPLQEERYMDYLQSEQVHIALSGKVTPFKAITRLRQICNHPAFYRTDNEVESTTYRPNGDLILHPIDDLFVREEYVNVRHSSRFAMKDMKDMKQGEGEDEDEDEDDHIDFLQVDWRESCKMVVLNEVLHIWKEEKHKVLIYTQTVGMLQIIQQYAEEQV